MLSPRHLIEKSKHLLPLHAWESYQGAPYDPESLQYLNDAHIEALHDNSEITSWRQLGEAEVVQGIGILNRIGFVTKRGYAYSAIIGTPESPECTVPVIGTSAWTTSTEGHNERTVRNFMRAGNYVFFVGAEGSYEPAQKPTPNGPITLADSAAATLNFSYHAAQELIEQGYMVDPTRRKVIGESRGGMVGMGEVALAEHFGQEVVMADFAAPCIPRRLRADDVIKLGEQIAKEPSELLRLAGKLTLARLIHYPSTIDPSPYSVKHQVAIGFALFSGEAGALARHIPQDSLIHITTFNNDIASMHDEWCTIFQHHPNVRITPLPGSHMTIADLETLQFTIARNKAAQICLNENEPLNQATVFEAAHFFAPEQKPLHHTIAA